MFFLEMSARSSRTLAHHILELVGCWSASPLGSLVRWCHIKGPTSRTSTSIGSSSESLSNPKRHAEMGLVDSWLIVDDDWEYILGKLHVHIYWLLALCRSWILVSSECIVYQWCSMASSPFVQLFVFHWWSTSTWVSHTSDHSMVTPKDRIHL